MNAKEMFEALGYKQKENGANYIRYLEERIDRTRIVLFNLRFKNYSTYAYDEIGDDAFMGVTPELHLAIAQQMTELGWK